MKKFFIVGCPRSGTTMLQQALNRHSQIAIPPETKYFTSFFGQPRRRQLAHLERLNADLGIHLREPAAPIASVAEGRAFFDLLAKNYVERLPSKDVRLFGEKTPEHTSALPAIREMYPEAKILVLCRDGRDVALSLSHMPWMSTDIYVSFLVWLHYSKLVRRATERPHPNIYFVRYEDIVTAPEERLSALLEFLGLRYEPAVAHGYGNREGVPPREDPWKARALGPISNDRVGLYLRELHADQIAILERLGKHVLPAFGYTLRTDGQRTLSARFLMRLSFNLARFVRRLPSHLVLREALNQLRQEKTASDPRYSPCATATGVPALPPFRFPGVAKEDALSLA